MAGSGEARPAAATVGPLIGFLQLHWLGRERIAAYSAILALGGLVSLYWFFRQAIGPQGSDFLAFWSAGRLAVEGHAAAAYDPAALGAVQAEVGRSDVFAFVNPPPMLLGIWPLGLMTYPAAWIAWVSITYAFWLASTRRLYPGLSWPIAAFPGALVAAWHAQTGFLTGALQAGAAGLLRNRPFCAGLCVGALIVKPHLAVLFPVAFLAGKQWRAIAGAVAAMAGLTLLTWLIFGTNTLLVYPRSWAVSDYLLRTGSDEFFLRQTTLYAQTRLFFGAQCATWVAAAATIGAAAATWLAWSRRGPLEGKLALLFAATPLATPYLFSYDLPFLAIPVCWLASTLRSGDLGGWGRPVVLGLYLSPLAARAAALPLGLNPMPLFSLAMVWLVWRGLDREVRPEFAAGQRAVRPGSFAGK